MEAQTLNCPMCGASASTDASKCGHCGARLATISCPSCFAMMFAGAKFCSHCGAAAARAEEAENVIRPCPRCRVDMKLVALGDSRLRECPKCEGLWTDKDTLQRICDERERQAAVLGLPAIVPTDAAGQWESNVRYVPCPVCQGLMNRVNFARCSKVIVDVCAQHGTWLDHDELRRIVEFIRAGGIDKARARELEELERRRRDLTTAQSSGGGMGTLMDAPEPSYEAAALGLQIAASVLNAFFRK